MTEVSNTFLYVAIRDDNTICYTLLNSRLFNKVCPIKKGKSLFFKNVLCEKFDLSCLNTYKC